MLEQCVICEPPLFPLLLFIYFWLNTLFFKIIKKKLGVKPMALTTAALHQMCSKLRKVPEKCFNSFVIWI